MTQAFESLVNYEAEHFNYTSLVNPNYYPRIRLDREQLDWSIPLSDYENSRADFATAATIKAFHRGTADPYNFEEVEREFSGLTNEEGRPLAPIGRTGIAGLGELWHWGESVTVDAVITRGNSDSRELLVIGKKSKDDKPALPGGFVKFEDQRSEEHEYAAVREVGEETGIDIGDAALEELGEIITRSRRTTDNAWIKTRGFWLHLEGSAVNQTPVADDDADTSRWLPLTPELIDKMSDHHAALVRARLEIES